MKIKNAIIILLFLLSSVYSLGQGFTYSYDDPCTLKTKEIYIPNPNGNVVLSYNGQTQSFTSNELLSGALQQWIEQVNSQNPSGPCSGIGLAQNTTINAIVAQNNIAVITTVLSALSDISSISSIGGSSIEGIIQVEEKTSSNNGKSADKPKNNINGTTNTNGGSPTNTNGNTGTSQSGGNQNNGTGIGNGTSSQGGTNSSTTVTPTTGGQSSQSPVTSNSVTSGNNNSTTPNTNNSTGSVFNQGQPQGQNVSEGGITDITGGVNSVKLDNTEKSDKEGVSNTQSLSASTSSSTKSKVASVRKGSVMMTGDIVVIGSAAGSDPSQIRVNTSIISSNTKNTFAKGALVNYTSQINNTNITLFTSYRYKKSTTILANSSMMNFDGDFFNTTSIMESYQIKKVTTTIGVNYTTGNLGESKFQSFSTLAGVFSSFNVNKKMGMTTMFVMVYSPYVFFYEGMWNQSGFLAVPFVAIDYKLTKKFKLNISFSGVQQIKDQPLNYQVLLGAKAFL
jgi:hypothetical protein